MTCWAKKEQFMHFPKNWGSLCCLRKFLVAVSFSLDKLTDTDDIYSRIFSKHILVDAILYMYYIYTFLPPFSFCLSLNFINVKLAVSIDCQNGHCEIFLNSFLYLQYVLSFYEYCVQCTYRTLTIFSRSYKMYMRTKSRWTYSITRY